MGIIKSYTDLSQGIKLKDILPLESADMHSEIIEIDGDMISVVVCGIGNKNKNNYGSPIWSLSALLGVLPNPSLYKTFTGWRCDTYNKNYTKGQLGDIADNPVDACVIMIEKLHKLNLL